MAKKKETAMKKMHSSNQIESCNLEHGWNKIGNGKKKNEKKKLKKIEKKKLKKKIEFWCFE